MAHLSIRGLMSVAATPWVALAIAAAASAAMLSAAFFFQFVIGLFPCELCLYQRYPYGAVVAVGLLGVLLLRRPNPSLGLAMLLGGACAMLFAVDAGVAAFHVGVEQGWWTGSESCVGGDVDANDLDALREAILAAPAVRCDDVTWSLFGISMAGWNFLVATGLTLAGMVAVMSWRRT
ncbi:MAG: disulfide bond formation protein B [Alphaproteobacteria bacterium]|jgi:disulfide bond formation protein DsbB|nr:disulfide bond formation protein B [Alphaproteobacteria bacterium]